MIALSKALCRLNLKSVSEKLGKLFSNSTWSEDAVVSEEEFDVLWRCVVNFLSGATRVNLIEQIEDIFLAQRKFLHALVQLTEDVDRFVEVVCN